MKTTCLKTSEGVSHRIVLRIAMALLLSSRAVSAQALLQEPQFNGTNVMLQWDTVGELQFAPTLSGPWLDATNPVVRQSSSTSPLTGPVRFFRVVDPSGITGVPSPIFPLQPSDPAPLVSAFVQKLPSPTSAGNAKLTMEFAPGTVSSSNDFPLIIADRLVRLRDDGSAPDPIANDGKFSGIVVVNTNELQAYNDHISGMSPSNRFTKEFRGREIIATNPIPLLSITNFISGDPISLFPTPCVGSPTTYDWRKTVMITNLSVVEDPTRTWDPCPRPGGTGTPMGAWTFGRLMTDMCNQPASGIDPSDFVLHWLRSFEFPQTINSDFVPDVAMVKNQIVNDWLVRSLANGFPAGTLDMSIAPFRLLAIVNRVDLRGNFTYGGGNINNPCNPPCMGGEARFVFAAVDTSCNEILFFTILEYCVPRNDCDSIRAWGQLWTNLDSIPFGPAYNAALQAITDQFAGAGANPSRLPNKSAINQVRVNEFLGPQWELREWKIFPDGTDAGLLREVTVKQTPDLDLDFTARVNDWVTGDPGRLATLASGTAPAVPEIFMHQPFLGGWAPTTNTPFWDGSPSLGAPVNVANARHTFSLNTCNACHTRETMTAFTHVGGRSPGAPATLSGFLVGVSVLDPVAFPSITRTFADLDRRVQDLDTLVNCPCLTAVGFRRLSGPH